MIVNLIYSFDAKYNLQNADIYNLFPCTLGDVEMRWIDTYFPFTNPSFELEIYFKVFYVHDCLLNTPRLRNSC